MKLVKAWKDNVINLDVARRQRQNAHITKNELRPIDPYRDYLKALSFQEIMEEINLNTKLICQENSFCMKLAKRVDLIFEELAARTTLASPVFSKSINEMHSHLTDKLKGLEK